MKTQVITKDQVVAGLKKVSGRKKNPTIYTGEATETCVYTDPRGRHCIAGQVLADLGVTLPGVDDNANEVGIENLARIIAPEVVIESDAIHLLDEAQTMADNESPTWGNVRKRLRQQGLL